MLKVFVVEVQIETSSRFPATVGCFFVLHLLVNRIIIMTIARKVMECVFILIQFLFYLRKQGRLFSVGVLKRIPPWVRLNGLFDLCTPWNCQKIIDFLMVLGEGRSLTGLPELVVYGSVVLRVFHLCYVGIPLIFWGVPLVFMKMFSCSAPVPWCFAIPPVFRVPLFRVPAFLVLYSLPYVVANFDFNDI